MSVTNPTQLTNSFPEQGTEAYVVVRNYLTGEAKIAKDMRKQEFGTSLRCQRSFRCRDKYAEAGQTTNDHKDVVVDSSVVWNRSQFKEVDGDGVKDVPRNGQVLQHSGCTSSARFARFANAALGNDVVGERVEV